MFTLAVIQNMIRSLSKTLKFSVTSIAISHPHTYSRAGGIKGIYR